jgi:transposase
LNSDVTGMGRVMTASPADTPTWSFPFSHDDWEHTPPAVRAHVAGLQGHVDQLQQQIDTLQQQIDTLKDRLNRTSKTSHKPPSSDSPFTKPQGRISSGKRGARPGHKGAGPTLLAATEVHHVYPAPCACGACDLDVATPYHTHQVVELPPIEIAVTHFVLHQGRCGGCGRLRKAEVPAAYATGYGPRLTALMGELAGVHGTSRRLIQDFCASVLHIPMSLGAVQKLIDRVSHAIEPHYEAIARLARHASVGYIDETPWDCQNTLQWLWTMVTDTVALYLIHPRRSKEAFAALIDDWAGILVSDGYGVYQDWGQQRQTCLAHLIRTARGLAARHDPDLAACGAWALKELQRLCQMAKAPPTGGEWRAWYARLCKLIDQYQERADDAGRLARRLVREMASLWVFLCEEGVEPPNNDAERALRFAVLLRKRSHGTASDKGNRWVERSLSLRQTCRQLGQSTFTVLVDAITSFFHGHQPNLSWLY